jgi:hypothetical protein
MSSDKVLELVRGMLDSVKQLESLYPGRSFTLDGHLVGSIGEVLAAELYGLRLLPSSNPCHDATCPAGRNVQVKLTQRSREAIYEQPDHLIVLRVEPDGTVAEVYNGPGSLPWMSAGPIQKNGQRSVSITTLSKLNNAVASHDRVSIAVQPAWFTPAHRE